MITQIFKYKKIHIYIGNDKFCINIPYYGKTTFLAMDPDGYIYTYDSKPTFNVAKNHFEVLPDCSYDLVAHFSGDASFYKGVISLDDRKYIYAFTGQ